MSVAVWLITASAALCQNARPASAQPETAHTPVPRPITRTEGRQILAALSSLDPDSTEEADCSHLVHDLYEQAGFSYDYASSRELYMGSTNFTRVRAPQPGDLVVWRGHVGIVLDPKEHSFFSSVRSGPDTQFYDSPYWRSRGIARFYRYMTDKPLRSGKTLEATRRREKEPLPAAVRSSENRPPIKPVKPASATTPITHSSAVTPVTATVEPARERPLQVSGKNPVADEISAAFADWAEESGDLLRAQNLRNTERSVIVYRQMQVAGVQVKGKRGTARVRIESIAALPAPQANPPPRWKELPLDLQKTKNGWIMAAPGEALYVPRETALQVLSARLAALTQQTGAGLEQEREQREIIRFLNLLVPDDFASSSGQNSAYPQPEENRKK